MKNQNVVIDLNLLKVFCAIWDLRSLTAAGDRLGLTQPAVSHALRRLRERFDDPLFVRSANRMLPTDVAIRLHAPIDQALTIINRAVQERTDFDPMESERTFRIAMSDVAEIYALPRLIKILGQIAPATRIDVVPLKPEAGVAELRSGEVDIAIGHIEQLDEGCNSVEVFNDKLICILRKAHPYQEPTLTREGFTNLRFFHARMTTPILKLVEPQLVNSEAKPQIAVRGRLGLAPEIVRTSDLAAIIPETMARGLYGTRDFRILDLPFDLPSIEVKVHTHERFNSDMGIRWLRDVAVETLRQSYAETVERSRYNEQMDQTAHL